MPLSAMQELGGLALLRLCLYLAKDLGAQQTKGLLMTGLRPSSLGLEIYRVPCTLEVDLVLETS